MATADMVLPRAAQQVMTEEPVLEGEMVEKMKRRIRKQLHLPPHRRLRPLFLLHRFLRQNQEPKQFLSTKAR